MAYKIIIYLIFIKNFKNMKDQQNIEPSEKGEKIDYNYENNFKLSIGTYMDAPKFIQDNEYIKYGYILNCNTYSKTLKSLFICHNETVNIWSHLLSSIFFIFLIWYTANYISNFNSQLKNVRKDISLLEKRSEFIKDFNLSLNDSSLQIFNNIYDSIKDMKINLNKFNYKFIYENSLKHISVFNDNETNLNESLNNNSKYTDKEINTNISSINNFSLFKQNLICLKEDIIDLIKLDKEKSKDSKNDLEKDLNIKERPIKKLAKWPLFIIIISAILLFTFSASFHSFGSMSATHYNILSRFDYGGISLLISGSCYPPYYYFFYFSKKFKLIYLSEITIFGISIFLYSLTDDFNKPKRRSLRGILFLIFGLCTGIPILHLALFGQTIKGYNPGQELLYWYIGAISYIVGALLYIFRFPEKKYPGKFDYIGASHQLFHILVFFGAFFHFLGSIDAYNYRYEKLRA